jgi:hypothetical protein
MIIMANATDTTRPILTWDHFSCPYRGIGLSWLRT